MNILRLLLLVTLTLNAFGAFVHKDGPYIIGNRVTPDASAMFQVETVEKGYLVPRLTTIQRDAIAAPAEGLQLFNTDTNALQVFAGGAWGSIGGGGSDHPVWTTTTGYGIGAITLDSLTWKVYRCNTTHTSDGTAFATDLALGYWDELSDDLDRLTISVDETLPRFDGITGGLIQSSGVTISDTDGVGNVTNLAIGSVSTLTSSIFDTTSTTQGTRPCPNMTEVQRDAIVAPADGLCIYNSSTDKLNLYNGTTSAWEAAGGGLNKWLTATAYAIDDVIWEPSSDKIYRANTAHTSSAAFITDIANWTELSSAIIPSFETTAFDTANEINGPVLHLDTLQEVYSHIGSSGVGDGFALTDNGDGTVNIALGVAAIRPTADHHSNILHANIAASGVLAITDASTNYVYIDYNAGTPQWVVSTSITAANGLDKVLGYIIARQGLVLKTVDVRDTSIDIANKSNTLFTDFQRFIHKEGGTSIGSSGLNVNVTAGKFYYGINPIDHIAFDTSIAGTANANVFAYTYTGWVFVQDSKLIDSTNYDNAGVLTAMGVGKFKVDWVYMINDSPSSLVIKYGTISHNNLASAELEGAPSTVPPAVEGVGVLIGRYIVQSGAASVTPQSAFDTVFSASAVTSHNDLSGLQGGTTDEYYHLTSAEEVIATQAATNLLDGYVSILAQSFAGIKTFVNGLLVDAGLVATPSIANSADTNTGIYFPAADSLGVTTGGVEKLLVNDHVSVTDDDGNFKVRKESRIRNIDQFKSTTPSSIYTEAGLTNAVTNETTTPIDGAQSAKFTVTTGDGTGTITRDAATSLLPKDYQLLGIHFDWLYDGNAGDVSLKIEESTDGITYTDLAEISLPAATEATLAKLNFKLSSTSVTHYRYLFYINVAVNGAIAEWDNVKVITDPLPTAQSVESEAGRYHSQTGYGSTNSKIPYFSTEVESTFSKLGTVVYNDSVDGFSYTAASDQIVNITYFYQGGTGAEHGLSLNSSQLTTNIQSITFADMVGYTRTITSGEGNAVSASIEMKAGDVLRPHTDGTATPDVTTCGITISATASSSNVVFEGHATDTETTSYTPTITGFGTTTNVDFTYRRVGDSVEIRGKFTSGIPTAVEAQLSLPSGLAIKTGDPIRLSGFGTRNNAVVAAKLFTMLSTGDDTFLNMATVHYTIGLDPLLPENGNLITANGDDFSFFATVPIQGWKVTDPLLSVPVTNEVENVYSARIANNGTATITSESAPFIESVTRSALGIVNVVFKTGFFTVIPSITAVVDVPTQTSKSILVYALTTSGFSIRSFNTSAVNSDDNFSFRVQRQGADYKHPKGYFLGNLSQPVGYLKEVQGSGINGHAGATFTAGSYVTRFLNTSEGDFGLFGTLSGNQFTLEAGTYEISGLAPARNCNRHKTKVRNITDSTDAIIGMGTYSYSTPNNDGESKFQGVITISSSKTFEIQHRAETTSASNGFGIASGWGENEVYTTVKIRKLK